MVKGCLNLIYYFLGKRVWEEGLKVKGEFHGVRSEGGMVVVPASWGK